MIASALNSTLLNSSGFHSIAQFAASRIADSLVEGALITAVAGGVLFVLRRFISELSSETRFTIWFSALIAVALASVAEAAALSGAGPSSSQLASGIMHPALVLPSSWGLCIFAGWISVSIVLLARVGIGLWHVLRIRKGCVTIDPLPLDEDSRELLVKRRARRVALCTSESVNVPTAIGFVRPAIVLPAWLLQELSVADLKQLVIHEVAHLRRYDDWTNLLQQIVKSLFFFHPAVWWLEKHISLEREMACDDAVIAATANPRAYAECLTHLAEKSMIRRGMALAQAALGRVHQTSLRVAKILYGDRPKATKCSSVAGAVVIIALALACGSVAARTPRLIVFAPEQPEIVTAHTEFLPQPDAAAREVFIPQVRPAVTKTAPSSSLAVRRTISGARSSQPDGAKRVAPAETGDSVNVFARWVQTSVDSSAPVQPVYFVVESSEYLPSGVVLYRTSVWRITVTRATENPVTGIHQKEI